MIANGTVVVHGDTYDEDDDGGWKNKKNRIYATTARLEN